MKLDLLFLEADSRLYAAYGFEFPQLIWTGSRWEILPKDEQKPWSGAVRLTPKEAERCFPGSSTAALPEGYATTGDFPIKETIRLRPDLFDSWDVPNPVRMSPEEQGAYDRQTAEYVRALRSRPDLADE